MPVNQQSYFGSAYKVNRLTKTYTASVDAARYQEYTASVRAVIQPDRYYQATTYVLPIGNYEYYVADVMAYFVPITPDRYITASVVLVPMSSISKTYTASVKYVDQNTYDQTYSASIQAVTPVDVDYTASVVPLQRNVDAAYSASLRLVPTPPDKTYQATLVAKKLDVNKTYTATIRAYVEVSPAEGAVRDADTALLISYALEQTSLEELVAASNARLTFLADEIARLITILNEVGNKPSCRLSSTNPRTNVPTTGGTTMFVLGFEFIPTCTVELTQGVVNIGTFDTVVQNENLMKFTLPDFTTVVGLDLNQPISIQVHNADGEDSEVVTFTLAS